MLLRQLSYTPSLDLVQANDIAANNLELNCQSMSVSIIYSSFIQDYPLHEGTQIGASRMIFKIVQSLIVKATPPLSISLESNADVMTVLDDIMHCE